MGPLPSYRIEMRAQRDKRILHMHSLGDQSLQIAKRLGTTTGTVNEILRANGKEPHYPYEGTSYLAGGKERRTRAKQRAKGSTKP